MASDLWQKKKTAVVIKKTFSYCSQPALTVFIHTFICNQSFDFNDCSQINIHVKTNKLVSNSPPISPLMKAVLTTADNNGWICLFGPLVTSCFIQWALLLRTNLCGNVSLPRSACHHIALSLRTKCAEGEYQISCQDQTEIDCESRRRRQQCWWSRSPGSCCRRQRRFWSHCVI